MHEESHNQEMKEKEDTSMMFFEKKMPKKENS